MPTEETSEQRRDRLVSLLAQLCTDRGLAPHTNPKGIGWSRGKNRGGVFLSGDELRANFATPKGVMASAGVAKEFKRFRARIQDKAVQEIYGKVEATDDSIYVTRIQRLTESELQLFVSLVVEVLDYVDAPRAG